MSYEGWTAIELCQQTGEYVFMNAKTAAQRKADERARKRAAGLEEVRGIFAPKDHHEAIREAAAKHLRKLERTTSKEQP